MTTLNTDPAEVQKFSDLAHRWWDPESEFKPLHQINPLRLRWIQRFVSLDGKKAADIGCGGGILSESLAQGGAEVTGLDMSEKALSVARLHLFESGVTVDYLLSSVEEYAQAHAGQFDVVTCMEMLEHVPDPQSAVTACATLLKPGGHAFFATLNRNAKSYLMAIVGAEYLLRLLPKGTHNYDMFIRPSELSRACRHGGLTVRDMTGMHYNPVTQSYRLGGNCDVNYIIHACKDA